MFWRRLSQVDYRILCAVPRSLSYSDVARATGLSTSYVSSKVKKLARSLWMRFWIDYRSIGLSPTYILCKFSKSFVELASRIRIPYVRVIRKVWDSDGAKLLIEATPPLGFERRFALLLPVAAESVWVKEWTAKYVPGDSRVVVHAGSSLEIRWNELPAAVQDAPVEAGLYHHSTSRRVDDVDLMILSEKEEFCFVSLSKIGEKMKVTQQLVSYHFRNHLKPLWKLNYVEPRQLEFPVVYRVEAENARTALLLLSALSRTPLLIDAFTLQGDEKTVIMLVDIPPNDLPNFHVALLSTEGVRRAEVFAFVDPSDTLYYGLTAHLGLRDGSWSLEPVVEALEGGSG